VTGWARRPPGARRGPSGSREAASQEPETTEAGSRRGVPAEPRDPEAYARGLLLDSLARSARTRGQLAELLARKEVPEEVAEAALDRFTELGLIDDAAYAEAFTRSRHEHKGLGSRAIAFELRRRSVPDELVQDAVSVLDSEQEQQTASRLAAERQSRMNGLPREVQARRLAGFLARKGYGGEMVGRAVREALANAQARADEEGFDPEDPALSEE
jgi:regulatory protein